MKHWRLLNKKRKYWYNISWISKDQQGAYCLSDSKELKDIDYDKIKDLMVKSNSPNGIKNKDDIVILNINKL